MPVATATARTPIERPQATSWTESPTTTTDLPVKRRPVCASARSTATGGNWYRSAESLPKAPKAKYRLNPGGASFNLAPRSRFPVSRPSVTRGSAASRSSSSGTPGLGTTVFGFSWRSSSSR